jgi:26S proteasome regulatory subunit T5
MSTGPDVNFEEIARSTDEFNGAQLKAVCVEAGMIALREGATKLGHEHFISGIAEGESYCPCRFKLRELTHASNLVQSKKKNDLMYFA